MPEKRDESFPGRCKLRRSNDFRRVFARGKRKATRYFVIYTLPNRLEVSRLGIHVRRKIGTAVTRNRVKRMIREVFRKMKEEIRPPVDLVLIAEAQIPQLQRVEFESLFREILLGVNR